MSGDNMRRVQFLLNANYIGENDAANVLDYCRSELQWTDRQIGNAALKALGHELDAGLVRMEEVAEVSVKADVLQILNQVKETVAQLATLDFSGARTASGGAVNQGQIKTQLTNLEVSASKLVSDFTIRDDDDE